MSDCDFVCRFRLTSLQAHRELEYGDSFTAGPTAGHPGVVVTLHPVKGDPFGKYTPSGEIKMTILNPFVATQLTHLWNEYVTNTDPKAEMPTFEVPFNLLNAGRD